MPTERDWEPPAIALLNPIKKGWELKHEKAQHRLMIELACTGHTQSEIMTITGFGRKAVQNTLAQDFAQERIVETAKRNAQDEIKELLEKACKPALERIILLSQTAASEQVQLAASQNIADRFLGKPTQVVEQKVVRPEEMTQEELDREVAKRLQQQEKTE